MKNLKNILTVNHIIKTSFTKHFHLDVSKKYVQICKPNIFYFCLEIEEDSKDENKGTFQDIKIINNEKFRFLPIPAKGHFLRGGGVLEFF